ncbi:MAG: hypothetical protein ACOC8N_08050 [Spirochaetota bacterium]
MRKNMIMIVLAAAVLLAGVPAFAGSREKLEARNREIADLQEQVARLETDAKFWRQLTALLKPVEMPLMTDHRAFVLPSGLVLALHFDNMDLDKAENLNWVAIGIPGEYWKEDQERVETLYGKGFTHFHDMENDIHGGEPGAKGVWFVHIAVRDFEAPWGPVTAGIDHNFMPMPAPERTRVSAAR